MEQGKRGSQGLRVSAQVLGCMSMSDFYGAGMRVKRSHDYFEDYLRRL